MPITPTRLPARTPQRRSGAKTVTPAQSRGAVCAASSAGGSGNANRPSRRIRSANPPGWPTHTACCFAQRFSWLARQSSHDKQAERCQPIPTRCPIASAHAAPAAATVPTISWPGTSGYVLEAQSLSIKWRSLWQIPQWEICTSTSSGPSGAGS